jgi:2,3-bisphosphoglycerate-independent phosphoglycerate mutase
MANNKIILVVRDGWGYTKETDGNAIYLAHTPINDKIMKKYPWTTLKCTGTAIGLPEGTQGGSEPGHLTMGAGRIVWQPLEEINQAIQNESFYSKQPFLNMFKFLNDTQGKLHLAGLFSDQGIHGTTHHLYALLELANRNKFKKVYVHCFLDGRDVPERSASRFIRTTQKVMDKKGIGKIATLIGRFYAMDRDTNWERTKDAYDLLTIGKGINENDPNEALLKQYSLDSKVTDYYINPITITDKQGSPFALVEDGDAFIFWNFRSDRARQLTYALTQSKFNYFKRKKIPNILFICMSNYDQTLNLPVVFPQNIVKNNLGNILANNGLNQLRIAETEKYAHVTFFFNSQIETPNKNEDRILVPSPKVPNYESQPEMSAYDITNKLVEEIEKNLYDFILVNYANCDLVGHSANLKASIIAVSVVDECVGKIIDKGITRDYIIIVTGDHGNIETLQYANGSPNPSHGTNPVPLILISNKPKFQKIKLKKGKGLSSIAPTILYLMNIEKPKQMTSESLIIL